MMVRSILLVLLGAPAGSSLLAVAPHRVGRGRGAGPLASWTPPSPDAEIDREAIKDTAVPQSSPEIQLDSTAFVLESRCDGEPSEAELSNERDHEAQG